MQTPYQFFKQHAGYSYNPAAETPEQGRQRCARSLARAERKASDTGMSFGWSVDPCFDSREFSDETPAYQLWQCVAYDSDGRAVAALSGIDFGRDGTPWGDTYRRVVEAELAAEALH